MVKKGKQLACWALVLLPLIVLSISAARVWFEAAELADHSAHEALTHEILDQLSAIPNGQPYPTNLSQLPLRYPDGGDASLLDRFEYQSDGRSYKLRTILGDTEIVKSAP
jgi:hypothetical protein